MKKLLSLLLVITSVTAFAQSNKNERPPENDIVKSEVEGAERQYKALQNSRAQFVSTTTEEYNYMSKGFASSLESGLDLKQGYNTGPAIHYGSEAEHYYFTYIPLNRVTNGTELFVGYIVNVKSYVSGHIYWYCIPYENSLLLNKTFEQFALIDRPMFTAFFKTYILAEQGEY